MASRSIILIALLMIITGSKRTMSKSLSKVCQTHMDCGRSRPICDGGFCRDIKSITEIDKLLKAPCRLMFKAPCQTDANCICNSIQMICESNECVVRKDSNMSVRRK